MQGPSALDSKNGRTVVFQVKGNRHRGPLVGGRFVDKSSHQVIIVFDFILDKRKGPLSIEGDEDSVQNSRFTTAIHTTDKSDVLIG